MRGLTHYFPPYFEFHGMQNLKFGSSFETEYYQRTFLEKTFKKHSIRRVPFFSNLLTVEGFQNKINSFSQTYVQHWNKWCQALSAQRNVALAFGDILRKWQACRPNRMRRTRQEAQHGPPFLEDLILQSSRHIQVLHNFDIQEQSALNDEVFWSLEQLWDIFQNLSYRTQGHRNNVRNGFAGVVGISKAVLLLTEGRVGPAFDSNVRGHLGIAEPLNAGQWFNALQIVSEDIHSSFPNHVKKLFYHPGIPD